MAGRHGQFSSSTNELWLRCPHCGDSQHDPNKAHYSVNMITGLAHCHRCSVGRKLSWTNILKLSEEYDIGLEFISSFGTDEDFEESLELPPVEVGAALKRDSKLERGHVKLGWELWDAFEMRDHDGEVEGLHLRRPNRMMSIGSVGLGYVGDRFPNSSEEDPLYIVEGPYDVLRTTDVCLFGFYSGTTLRKITGHFIVFCPDGDVWNDQKLFNRFLQAWGAIENSAYVCGIEVIPDGLDPDECPPASRTLITRIEMPSFIEEVKKVHGYQYTTHSSYRGSSRFRKVKSLREIDKI